MCFCWSFYKTKKILLLILKLTRTVIRRCKMLCFEILNQVVHMEENFGLWRTNPSFLILNSNFIFSPFSHPVHVSRITPFSFTLVLSQSATSPLALLSPVSCPSLNTPLSLPHNLSVCPIHCSAFTVDLIGWLL